MVGTISRYVLLPSIATLLPLLEQVLVLSFSFDNQHHQQVSGVAIEPIRALVKHIFERYVDLIPHFLDIY